MKLTEMQYDAMKEIGNVGIGNAATALSKLMNKKIDLALPESKFVSIENFAEECGGAETQICSLYLDITGGLEGETFFFFKEKDALALVNLMGLQAPEMNEDAVSAFKEMSNIFTGAYLNSISKMLNMVMLPGIPSYGNDMLGSLIDGVLIKYGMVAHELMIIKTNIMIDDFVSDGVFLFFFSDESVEKIAKTLNTMYNIE